MHPEAGHILVTRDPRDTIGEHSGCPFHDNCLEGLIAGPGVKKRWGGKSAGEMADDPEAMDLLAGYLAQALMTYILCYAPQKIVIGGGVADHTPIAPLARKKCAEMLNGYIVTPEMADIDSYIVNNSLEGKQGIMGLPGPGRTGASVADAPTGRGAPGKSDLRNDATTPHISSQIKKAA